MNKLPRILLCNPDIKSPKYDCCFLSTFGLATSTVRLVAHTQRLSSSGFFGPHRHRFTNGTEIVSIPFILPVLLHCCPGFLMPEPFAMDTAKPLFVSNFFQSSSVGFAKRMFPFLQRLVVEKKFLCCSIFLLLALIFGSMCATLVTFFMESKVFLSAVPPLIKCRVASVCLPSLSSMEPMIDRNSSLALSFSSSYVARDSF